MMTEKIKEYFERWPEPEKYRDYEYDGPISDPERLAFVLSLSEDEQKEILRRESESEASIVQLFS